MKVNIGSHQAPYLPFQEVLEFSKEGMKRYGNGPGFQRIRSEMGGLLFDLQRSRSTVSADKQVHYLFLALHHLDMLEQEIRTSTENEEIIRVGMVMDKIRSLRQMIADHIHHLKKEGNT